MSIVWVSDSVRDKLAEVAGALKGKRGTVVSFSEVIEHLLDARES